MRRITNNYPHTLPFAEQHSTFVYCISLKLIQKKEYQVHTRRIIMTFVGSAFCQYRIPHTTTELHGKMHILSNQDSPEPDKNVYFNSFSGTRFDRFGGKLNWGLPTAKYWVSVKEFASLGVRRRKVQMQRRCRITANKFIPCWPKQKTLQYLFLVAQVERLQAEAIQ